MARYFDPSIFINAPVSNAIVPGSFTVSGTASLMMEKAHERGRRSTRHCYICSHGYCYLPFLSAV